jgi:hypothetical protein
MTGRFDNLLSEFVYEIDSEHSSVLVRMFNLNTITQIASSADWFKSSCKQEFKGISWTVFLCYDTDSHSRDISKFYEGDWKKLRDKLKGRGVCIVDLAARAMIEDIFLLDSEGICRFLEVIPQSIPKTGNAKKSLKDFFRKNGRTYHEGERAKDLIWSLDKDKIIDRSEIQFTLIEEACFI